jgi:hypothetical protein
MTKRLILQPPSLPESVSFSGHETFILRYGWLKKAFDAVTDDPEAFSREGAIVTLGVGKNMVRSIRHWALVTGILKEEPGTRGLRLQPTNFGSLIFPTGGVDPFLEDTNSIWLLHWQICTNASRATTWVWAFSLLRGTEFTPTILRNMILGELEKRGMKAPTANTLKRDIECFVRSYVPVRSATLAEDTLDSPLSELRLIEQIGHDGLLSFRRGPKKTLADEIFAFCVLDFWNRQAGTRETLTFNEIAYGFCSPGSILKLDENSLVERLESLEKVTNGALLYADTAGLKQIYRRRAVVPESLFTSYFDYRLVCV